MAIFIRSIFRVAELSEGFDGKLANDEATFMILEGAMIIIGVTAITVMHPCFAFGNDWSAATWSLRAKKGVEVGLVGKNGQASESELVEMK